MHSVQPQARFIAETNVHSDGIELALHDIGMDPSNARGWVDQNVRSSGCRSGEILTEFGGRLCYKSFEVGLNPNVTKIREGNQQYIGNILSSKHGSVLEHAHVTFAFTNVSRVFTHEIVRHRAGCAFSQESLRYVRLEDLGCRVPPFLTDDDFLNEVYEAQPLEWRVQVDRKQFISNKKWDVNQAFKEAFQKSEEMYTYLCNAFNIDGLKDFGLKKFLTSAFRRVAPIGLSTNIMVTCNHRAWRHIIELRAGRDSINKKTVEEEMVHVIGRLTAPQLKERFPNIYQDMTRNENGEWIFANSKI